MTTRERDTDIPGHDGPDPVPTPQNARAFTGPAHGQQWTVGDNKPAPWVELPIGASSCLYRLVRRRRTGSPARDHRGNYLYVPMSEDVSSPTSDGECRVLEFPADRTATARSRTTR